MVEKKIEIVERLEGGLHKIETKQWWIVRFACARTGNPVAYLQCKNTGALNRRKNVRRRWEVTYSTYAVYQFESLSDAKRAARSAVVKDRLAKRANRTDLKNRPMDEVVEVVEVVSRTETISTEIRRVQERPGCNPMLALALETAQTDTRAKQEAARNGKAESPSKA